MTHTINSELFFNMTISIIEEEKEKVTIKIFNNHNEEEITLSKKELYNFIGTLLHVQAKMKEGKNG